MAAALREIGKQDVESLTKADETMLRILPLGLAMAQKMSKVFDRCASKQVRTELMEGSNNTYGIDMATEILLKRFLYYMCYYDKPFQDQLDVMATRYYLRIGHGSKRGEIEG